MMRFSSKCPAWLWLPLLHLSGMGGCAGNSTPGTAINLAASDSDLNRSEHGTNRDEWPGRDIETLNAQNARRLLFATQVSWVSIGARGSAIDWHETAWARDACRVSEEEVDHLRDIASHILHLAIVKPQPKEYLSWRFGRGDIPRPMEEIVPPGTKDPRQWFESWSGLLPDPDWSKGFEQVFKASVDWRQSTHNPASHVVQWFDFPQAYAISIGRMPARARISRPALITMSGPEWWYDNGAISMHSMFQMGDAWSGLTGKRTCVCAEVGFILRFADGHARPLVLTCVLDENTRNWLTVMINMYDIPAEWNIGGIAF